MQPVGDGGGSEHALIRMVGQLASDGWECHVVLPGPARLSKDYAAVGARLHYLPMERLTTSGGAARWLRFALRWPLTVLALARLARRTGAGVIHTNSLHSWYGWAAAVLVRRPHLWHAREIVFQSGPALRVERFLAGRFATRVIAVSEAVAAQLDPANVTVIYDEADVERFCPERAGRFRSGAGVADDVPLAGSIARLDTWKGFEVLLDAYPSMKERRPDLQLVVAGPVVPGKEGFASELEHRCRSMEGVHWLGPRSDVGDVMADLDVFVQVSTEAEPFGLVVVEALACGVPVVAGAAGGPLEILGREAAEAGSPAGRLVPAGDPDALAAAVVELLPAGGSSVAARASRRPLRTPTAGRFAELLHTVTGL